MKKERNSNIELLRLISIFLIVLSHAVQHATIDVNSLGFGFNKIVLESFSTGHLGVVIFLLISGYCGISRTNHNWGKNWYFIFRVFSYSFLIYTIMLITGNVSFSIMGVITNFLPIIFNKYWFVTAFFVFNLFTPYLNKFLNILSINEYRKYLVIGVIVGLIIPFFTMQEMFINEILQFMIFYSIGGYLKLYPDNIFARNFKKIFIITLGLELACLTGLNFISEYNSVFNHGLYIGSRNSIFTILIAISVLMYFAKKTYKSNNVILKLSSSAFGIYLLHDNEYIRNIIWGKLFNTGKYFELWSCIPYVIMAASVIFIGSLIIDFIKTNTLDKLLTNFSDWLGKVTERIFIRLEK